MSDGIMQNVSKGLKSDAKASAKKMKQEPLEMWDAAKSQIVRTESARSPIVNQIVTRDGVVDEVSDTEKQEIEARTRNRLRQLEEELEKIRSQRKEKEKEWEKSLDAQMAEKNEGNGDKKLLIQPTTKRKRGILGNIKKRQGTREIGRGPSG